MGRIERRKRTRYHRWGEPAAVGGNMAWQADSVNATQFTYTICIFVMLQKREQNKKKEKKTRTAGKTIVVESEPRRVCKDKDGRLTMDVTRSTSLEIPGL